ncbi:MAG: hypothetical protein WKF95_16035 [Rubrobacter sp.]
MKSVLAMTMGFTGIVALLLMAILTLGSPAQEPARDAARAGTTGVAEQGKTGTSSGRGGPRILSEEEALRQDARWYARDMGVSLDEAIRHLEMQDDTLPSDLERELKKSEGDTFAGLWLRHKPDYGLTVATAGDPEAMMQKIEPFVAGTQWEGTVNVKQVEATEAQLNAARAEADRIIDRLGISRVSSDLNVFKNRAEFYVPDKTKFERRLDASGLKLPDHVAIIEGLSRPT